MLFRSYAPWPTVDVKYLTEDSVTLVVQVNGRVRARIDLAKGASEEEVFKIAKSDPNVSKHIDGKEIRKVIFVPDRLLNLVV